MTKLIVGIDFGTSTTVVRYKREGTDNIVPIKDKDGVSDIIPSAIFIRNDGQKLYGNEAKKAYAGGMDGEYVTNFKMGLLSVNEPECNTAVQHIKDFLGFVYQCFRQQVHGLHYDSLDVYVSYPAKWSDSFINFMKKSTADAGFGTDTSVVNIVGINEPKAATYNFLGRNLKDLKASRLLTPGKPMHVFMLDMGAGTTDIVIFKLTIDSQGKIDISNLLSYPSVDNPNLCGGREIDKILTDYVLKYVSNETGIKDLDEDLFSVNDAKIWKEQTISTLLEKHEVINLPMALKAVLKFMPNGVKAYSEFALTRQSFEAITSAHWKELYTLITSAINLYNTTYGIGAEDIDLLFRSGGHAQWYTVPNLFDGEGVNGYIGVDHREGSGVVKALDFKKLREEPWRMFLDVNPHETVAEGLCMLDTQLLPKGIAIGTCPNNVWVQLDINKKKSELVQIVNIGEKLPAVHSDIQIDFGKIESDYNGKDDFRGSFTVYTGEKLESAIIQQEDINLDVDLFTFLIPGNKYFINCTYEVSMSEEGTLSFKGDVSFRKDFPFAPTDHVKFVYPNLEENNLQH